MPVPPLWRLCSPPADLTLRVLLGELTEGSKAEQDCLIVSVAGDAVVKTLVIGTHARTRGSLTLRVTRGRNRRGPCVICRARDGTVGFTRLLGLGSRCRLGWIEDQPNATESIFGSSGPEGDHFQGSPLPLSCVLPEVEHVGHEELPGPV